MFIDSLKFLLRFGTGSIFEEVSQTTFYPIGTNTTPSVSGSGYLMQDDQYLFGDGVSSNGYNVSITNEYTVGFWLYPLNPGVAVDSVTGALLSIERPLIDFAENSSAQRSVIEITEHTQTSGNNSLRISEIGGYSAYSEEYDPDKWHYFWISRDSSTLQIFVDGVEHTLQDESGSKSSLDRNFLDVYINHNLDGYSTSEAKNTGVVDDIFLLNVKDVSQSNMQRAINDGVIYLVDDNYTNTNSEKMSIYMSDPDMITINSMVDDLSYVFIGRNDGKIMRGSALFWETRKSFSDSEEYKTGGISSSLKGDLGTSDDGFLVLNKATIRL